MNANHRPFLANPWSVLVVLATLFFLFMFVVLPCGMNQSHQRSRLLKCRSNLKQIVLAAKQFGADNDERLPQRIGTNATEAYQHFLKLTNELGNPGIFWCPTDNERLPAQDFGRGFSNSNVSYFINLARNESDPQQFLFGDRNLSLSNRSYHGLLVFTNYAPLSWTRELHGNAGNVAFTDGSVQQWDMNGVQNHLLSLSNTTHRLLFP